MTAWRFWLFVFFFRFQEVSLLHPRLFYSTSTIRPSSSTSDEQVLGSSLCVFWLLQSVRAEGEWLVPMVEGRHCHWGCSVICHGHAEGARRSPDTGTRSARVATHWHSWRHLAIFQTGSGCAVERLLVCSALCPGEKDENILAGIIKC